MPDFERVFRDLEVRLSPNPDLTKARHEGEDRARKQIAWIAGIIAALAVAAYSFSA